MESGVSGPGLGSPMYCGKCGRPLTAGLAACTNCGTPVTAAVAAQATPILTNDMTVLSGPTWQATATGPDSQAPTWQTPAMAAGASSPKRGRRAVVMGGIGGLLVVALLATGVAYVLGAFAGHSELDAAKYLPANTLAFSGLDVYSLAENSHNISLNSLVSDNGNGSLTGAGLDWTNDVLPWLGRDVAAGAFPATTTAGAAPSSPVSGAVLIQSHDDGKALAAMKKAADHDTSGGATTSTYNGFTLYSQIGGMTFTAGNKGWAVIATDVATAKVIIDRLNGTGDTLANQQAFQQATQNLPNSRFGTVYVNVRAIESIVPSDQLTPEVKQALEMYPIGVGYTSWSDAGLHAQVTLNTANNAGTQYPSGNASALALAVPANAYAYVSVGNLGGDLQAGAKQLGSDASASIADALGVPLTDPALQQPAALAVFPATDNVPGEALLLKAPNATAASSFLQALAAAHDCAIDPSTGADDSETTLNCPAIDVSGLGLGGTASDDGLTADDSGLPIVVAQTNGMLIFALDDGSIQAVKSTLNGGASLAQASTFKSLVAQAAQGAQTLAYVNITSFTDLFGSIISVVPTTTTGTTTTSPIQPTALLISSVSDRTKTSVSIDVALK